MSSSGAFDRLLGLFLVGLLISGCAQQSSTHSPLDTHDSAGIINAEKVTPELKDPLAPLIVKLELETHNAKTKETSESICTGVLINQNVVLTAAHCLDDAKKSSSFIEFGKGTLLFIRSHDYKILREASFAIVHEEYKLSAHRFNDVALVFFKKPFYKDWSDFPNLKFDSKGWIGPGAIVTSYGFGAIEVTFDKKGNRQTKSDGLLRRKVFKVADEKDVNPKLWRYSDAIYLTNIPSEPVGSICSGDSGGATFANVNGNYILVGVTSYMFSTCDSDSAVISLREHIKWVQNKILEGYSKLE